MHRSNTLEAPDGTIRRPGRSGYAQLGELVDTREVPAYQVTISAKLGAWALEVGVMADLPVPVLLGCDWPGFDQLLASMIRIDGKAVRDKRRRRTWGRRPVLMAPETEREGECTS